MDISQYFVILLRRMWLVLLLTMVAAGSALTVSAVTVPIYAATATVLVNQAPHGDLTDQGALVTGQELARTYVQLLTKRPILEETITTAGVTMSPEDLQGAVQVAIVGDTGVINIQVENADPALAAKLANLIPTVFTKQNGARQASRYADLLTNLSSELDGVSQQIAQTQAQIELIPESPSVAELTKLQQLQSSLYQLQNSYASLTQTYDSTRLAETQATSNIQVVEPALVPTVPVRPQIFHDTVLAGAVGFVLAIGLVFLMEYLDDRLRTAEQVTKIVGAPVVGTIGRFKLNDRQKKAAQSFISVTEPRSPTVEAFRMLRTNLRSKSVDHPLRSILVTSVAPTEGKSTVSANLAVVLAQTGLKVLLVDVDMRRPSVHTLFGWDNSTGITDMIFNGRGYDPQIIEASPIENLSILTSGPIPDNPAELLESERFAEILRAFTSHFDVVIMDSPPLLPVTDSTVLAPLMDGVVLVVDIENTKAGMLRQGKTQLDNVDVKLLGVVMNKVPPSHAVYPHYYEYYRAETKSARAKPTTKPAKNGRTKGAPPQPAEEVELEPETTKTR